MTQNFSCKKLQTNGQCGRTPSGLCFVILGGAGIGLLGVLAHPPTNPWSHPPTHIPGWGGGGAQSAPTLPMEIVQQNRSAQSGSTAMCHNVPQPTYQAQQPTHPPKRADSPPWGGFLNFFPNQGKTRQTHPPTLRPPPPHPPE